MNQIETARILIRPYRPSDADSVWQVLRRKEIYSPELSPGTGGLVDPVCGKREKKPYQLRIRHV